MYYYSLKTKTEEHCLEQRIFGGFDYGVYDVKTKELLKKKKVITQEEAVKFIYDLQVKMKAKFMKVDVTTGKEFELKIAEEKKVEKKATPKKEQPSTQQSILAEQIKKELAKRGAKGAKSVNVEDIEDATGNVHTESYVLDRGYASEEEYLESKDRYRLIAELDHNTGLVSIEVQATPSGNSEETCNRAMELIDKLLRGVVQSFPDLVDNHFISAGALQTGASYEEFAKGYNKKGNEIATRAKARCLDAIMKAVKHYKE